MLLRRLPLSNILLHMNVDRILDAMNRHEVEYLLIGGVNFLLRHEPVMTYDIDLWINYDAANLRRCEKALISLGAAWGPTDTEWQPVARCAPGWLDSQPLFCLTSDNGAIDIFRQVTGLESWTKCRQRAVVANTSGGVRYYGLADQDMLKSQDVLDESARKPERIRILRRALGLQ